jgi:general secretion pathway protein A
MYYSYFNLDKKTFASAPSPKYVFKATPFLAARSQLVDGFRNGKTIGIVTGKAGIGKTVLCHYLMSKLSTYRIASITVNPLHTSIELLTEICDQLHIDYPQHCDDVSLILERFREFFRYTNARKERTIIIMDEAQNIGDDLFQYLGDLTNSANSGKTKQHIVLAGHPVLIEHMQSINFLPSREADVVRSELLPMHQQDTIAYIRHRLFVGGAKDQIFTSTAESIIFQHTEGVFRSINILCDHCLRIAQQCSEPIVTPKIVKRAIRALSPHACEDENNQLKQKLTRLKSAPEKVVIGVSDKFEEVWRPLQQKISAKSVNLKQDKNIQIKREPALGDNRQLFELPEVVGVNNTSPGLMVDGFLDFDLPEIATPANEIQSDSGTSKITTPVPADMVIVPDSTLMSAYRAVEITVPAFLLDKTPVTNQLYAKYIKETNGIPPDHWWNKNLEDDLLDHPVVGVSYRDACRFAEWCGKRLPTASEWEAAARRPGDQKFPWGDSWDPSRTNCVESGLNNTTTSVNFHPTGASIDGCLDLVGNVWEWTDAESEQTDLEAEYAFVFGGSFRHESIVNDTIARTMLLQMNHYAYVGFRCAKDFQ